MSRALFLALLPVVLNAVPAAASAPRWAMPVLEQGLAAHRAQDFATARTAFARLAGEGSAVAETMLGTMHARGEGVARDPATAATWWLRAANRGYPPAQFALARAYADGQGVGRDAGAAWVWARLAATHGDTPIAARAAAFATELATGLDAATLATLEARRLEWRPWPAKAD